mgnify:FL=1
MTPTMAPRLRATVSAVCRAEDLTAAIKAVTPHVGKEKDGGGVERVRVVTDAERMRLALIATNRQRAAVALVPLLEVDDPTEPGTETDTTEGLDFTAPALKVITQVFKSTGTDRLRLDITAQTLQATDVDGLLEGRTIRIHAQGEYFDESGLDRVDGAATVLRVCAEPIAQEASFLIPEDQLAAWKATATALGGLPLVATATGHLLVACGALESLMGLTVLATGAAYGTTEASLGVPAYDGPAVEALMDLLLDGTPPGGEPAREAEHTLVTEIQNWIHTQTSTTETSGNTKDTEGDEGAEGPFGGDAA